MNLDSRSREFWALPGNRRLYSGVIARFEAHRLEARHFPGPFTFGSGAGGGEIGRRGSLPGTLDETDGRAAGEDRPGSGPSSKSFSESSRRGD